MKCLLDTSMILELNINVEFSLASDNTAMQSINAAIADFKRYTCIKLRPRSNDKDYVFFFKGSG